MDDAYAAIVVATILQRGDSINSVGDYLWDLTKKARKAVLAGAGGIDWCAEEGEDACLIEIAQAAFMKTYTVFYAWQSDTDQKYNRNLIPTALDIAAKAISDDPSIDAHVEIDSDTQGVAGEPHVSETLLAKIEESDFFAPDLTFVGRAEGGSDFRIPTS
jgi:hypothetical protein